MMCFERDIPMSPYRNEVQLKQVTLAVKEARRVTSEQLINVDNTVKHILSGKTSHFPIVILNKEKQRELQ